MKKSTAILIGAFLFSFLFYNQGVGVNYLIFTVVTLVFLFVFYKDQFKQRPVQLLSLSALISGISAFVLGYIIAAWGMFLSFAILSGVIAFNKKSMFFNLISSVYSMFSVSVVGVLEIIKLRKSGQSKNMLKYLSVLVPAVFVCVFFSIYRSISPLFEKLTDDINLDFISVGFLFFTVIGALFMATLLFPQRILKLDAWEERRPLSILENNTFKLKWAEHKAFMTLFVLVNLMLLAVNALDINYLYLGAEMPKGVTHKQFVHNGVYNLITSIILGITILIFFFRGKLNFIKESKFIKTLAYLWIVQNVFMIVSTAIRNTMYVQQALLTYKRLGVYVWLIIALIALGVIFYKLIKNKTVWLFLRYNVQASFAVFIICIVVDWDGVIYNFNIDKSHQIDNISAVDKNYLLSLQKGDIANLYSLVDKKGFDVDSSYSYRSINFSDNKQCLDHKLIDFINIDQYASWREFSLKNSSIKNNIYDLHNQGKLTSMDLSDGNLPSLEVLKDFNKIVDLNLKNGYLSDKKRHVFINNFIHLRKLNLSENGISELDTLIENQSLTYLDLNNNEIEDLEFLYNFPNLDTFYLKHNKMISLASLPEMKKMKFLKLDGNPLYDLKGLKQVPNLEYLNLSGGQNFVRGFPSMSNLKTLKLVGSFNLVLSVFSENLMLSKLEELDISNAQLDTLRFLKTNINESKVPSLVKLIIANNGTKSLEDLNKQFALQYIDASNNHIKNLEGLESMIHLNNLNLQSDSLNDISILERLINLEYLNLKSNPAIDDFSSLNKLVMLKELNLGYTSFDSLELISNCKELEFLNLWKCRVENWETVEKFEKLKSISLSFLVKEDIQYLKNLKNLKLINVNNTEQRVIKTLRKELIGVEIVVWD